MATPIEFLRVDGPDDEEDTRRLVAVLRDTIATNTDQATRKAALDIHEFIAVTEPEDIEEFLWEFWELLLEFAEQIPPDHPGQDVLANVVAELVKLPTTSRNICSGMKVWKDIPVLEQQLLELYVQHDYKMEADDNNDVAWIYMNSFVARLLALDVGLSSTRLTNVLRNTLERPEPPTDTDLIAAAEWLIRASEHIYSNIESETFSKGAFPNGEIYRGTTGVSRERWSFWKERFIRLGDGRKLPVQESVRRAVESMESAEESDSLSVAETLHQ